MKTEVFVNNVAGQETQAQSESSFNMMISTLNRIISDGLRHGFFDLSVACQIGKERKREVTIKAGKNFRFVIPESELKK
jgi:hypothetical protein